MTRSPIEDLAIQSVVDDALAEAAAPMTFDAAQLPFATDSVEGRLEEIDAQLSPSVTFGGAVSGLVDRARVPKPMRAIPGGDAFAELLDPEATPQTFGLGKRIKELCRRVSAFLARLREGLFGFERVLCADGGVRVTLASALDSDVELVIVGGPLGDPLDDRVRVALRTELALLADGLAVFAKVVEIVVVVVKAATNPVTAVRSLWRALVGLYELLIAHLEARSRARVDDSRR